MVMPTITPSLWLAPEVARAAAALYVSLFADARLESNDHFDNPAGPDYNADLFVVSIGNARLQIMGAPRTPPAQFTDALSLSVVVSDQSALDKVWDGFLSAGGAELACSWIVDPYGVRWQVLPQAYFDFTSGDDSNVRQRVVEALWQMVRVDVAKLEAAAHG